MGILKRLFAGPEEAAKLVTAGISGIDAAFWTKEEKSEWTLRWMDATQSQNVARRLLSFMVSAVYLCLLILAAAAWPLKPDYSAFIMEEVVGVHLSALVAGVWAFYFGTHLLRANNQSKK